MSFLSGADVNVKCVSELWMKIAGDVFACLFATITTTKEWKTCNTCHPKICIVNEIISHTTHELMVCVCMWYAPISYKWVYSKTFTVEDLASLSLPSSPGNSFRFIYQTMNTYELTDDALFRFIVHFKTPYITTQNLRNIVHDNRARDYCVICPLTHYRFVLSFVFCLFGFIEFGWQQYAHNIDWHKMNAIHMQRSNSVWLIWIIGWTIFISRLNKNENIDIWRWEKCSDEARKWICDFLSVHKKPIINSCIIFIRSASKWNN